MMEDGTPPPASVTIERVCNSGAGRPQTYTDSKGHFSFQWGNTMDTFADASVDTIGGPGTTGSRSGRGGGSSRFGSDSTLGLMGCELRAVLPGFRSNPLNLSGHQSFDTPDVGTIVLHRMANVEGTTISFTSLQAPKDAKKAFDKAQDAVHKNKLADAQKDFEKAVQIHPKYAAAWFELGRLHQRQNDAGEARKCYLEAVAADSKFISPYMGLTTLAIRENRWADVADTAGKIVKLNPIEFPEAHYYRAVANFNLQNLMAAEESSRAAQKLDTEHRLPKNDHLLGVILLQKQDYAGAAQQLRTYLKLAPDAADAPSIKAQAEELEKLGAAPPKENQQQ